MPRRVLVDAGPLVAFLNKNDVWHQWAIEQFQRFRCFVTCEPVLAEVCARLAYEGIRQWQALELLDQEAVVLDFDLAGRIERVKVLMEKYEDRPMDLADACLVAMTEDHADSVVVTLDRSDFSVYRRLGRDVIPIITPSKN
jgi:predicted nucleic acid-binding protein